VKNQLTKNKMTEILVAGIKIWMPEELSKYIYVKTTI